MRIEGQSFKTDGSCSITIESLTKEQHDKFIAVLAGVYHLTVKNGEPTFSAALIPLPQPHEDPKLDEFWPQTKVSYSVVLFPPLYTDEMFSIIIEHLCGYAYSEENYGIEAKRLEAFGFKCCRSRRGSDGRFMEQWVLPIFAAKGRLAAAYQEVKHHPKDKVIREIVTWLCNNVSFGSVKISHQVAAQVLE